MGRTTGERVRVFAKHRERLGSGQSIQLFRLQAVEQCSVDLDKGEPSFSLRNVESS